MTLTIHQILDAPFRYPSHVTDGMQVIIRQRMMGVKHVPKPRAYQPSRSPKIAGNSRIRGAENDEKIIDAIRKGEPMSSAEITEVVGLRIDTVVAKLKRLFDEGRVKRRRVTMNANQYEYFVGGE